jgi:hypothetical protein
MTEAFRPASLQRTEKMTFGHDRNPLRYLSVYIKINVETALRIVEFAP